MKVRRSRRCRGIYLITTLLLLVFLVMLLVSVTVSFQQGLASSGNLQNRQLALDAALSGLHYIQARLESNVVTFSPPNTTPTRSSFATADGSFMVCEYSFAAGSNRAWNICGYMNNANVSGSGEQAVAVLFRACFNGDYQAYNAQPSSWTFVTFGSGWNPPPVSYVSMNNLVMPASTVANSYDSSGHAFNSVPGQYADVIVEGIALGPGGAFLASRNVESMVTISGVNLPTTAASSAGDMDLTVGKSGGSVVVSSTVANAYGLSTLSNINLYGRDSVTGGLAAPPDYTSSAKANLVSTSTKHFDYYFSNVPTDFTSTMAQAKTVNPPAITQSQLPPLRTGSVSVNAGTWVVWNGALYHYPVDYQVADASGNPIAVNAQPWTPSSSGPPKYNAVSTDSPAAGYNSLDLGGGQLPFSRATNTLTVSTNDVNVVPSRGINTFAFVVAPSAANGTVTTDSGAVGSAQLIFNPPSGGTTPQFRTPGTMTVAGNVLGQGSVVSMGKDAGGASIEGDINVIGKSVLDPRPDSGIALYAAGNMNFWQLSEAQAPAAAPAVSTAMANAGIVPGSGGSGVGPGGGGPGGTTVSLDPASTASITVCGMTLTPGGPPHSSVNPPDVHINTSGSDKVGVSINGPIDSRSTVNASGSSIATISISAPITSTLPISTSGSSHLQVDGNVTVNGSTSGSSQVTGTAFEGSVTGNFTLTGTGTVASPSPSPGASSGASSGASPPPSLDQTFTGLVYAQKNVTMINQCGQVTLTGALVAYGGDPNTQSPGADGTGKVQITGNSVNLTYNPSVLGRFASLLGGQVILTRRYVTVF